MSYPRSGAAAFSGGFGSGFGSVGFGSVEAVSLDGLSPDNALIFKKIVKKDATTKIKGLEELRKFIEENASGEHDNLNAVLNKWTSEFPRLVEDASPKVRLLAVKLMGLIGKTFKSKLMSNLRELIPAWMCGVYDPRKEIGDAALEGLRSTIPESKHDQTMNFVRDGVIDYVEAHLSTIMETSGKLLTAEPTAEDDSESFSRICSTNIQLLTHLCEKLKPEEFTKISTKFNDLMEARIRCLSKAVDPKIRGDLYSLWAALLRHSDFVQPQLESTAKSIIESIRDENPATQGKAWGALVSLLKAFPIFSQPWFNLKKLFLPALSQSLKSTHATAATYDSLLPMLSTIPHENLSLDFLNAFFPDLWRALKNESVVTTVVSAYFDCLIFLLPRVNKETSDSLFEKHFLPIFEGYFTYAKELSENITQTMTLFIIRIQAKSELSKELSPLIWSKLVQLTQKQFILSSNDIDLPPSYDSNAAATISNKVTKFLQHYQRACVDAKQDLCDFGATNFLSQLLAPSLQHLHELGLLSQIECIADTGSVWRSIASLTMIQERKKAEASEFVASHVDAPQCVFNMVRVPLTSSLHMSVDNSEWKVLLQGFTKQRDFEGIKDFMSHDKDSTFWQCDILDELGLGLLPSEQTSESSSLLTFLIDGNQSGSFLTNQALSNLTSTFSELSKKILKDPSVWSAASLTHMIEIAGSLLVASSRAHLRVIEPLIFLSSSIQYETNFSWQAPMVQLLQSTAQRVLAESLPKALEHQLLGENDLLSLNHITSMAYNNDTTSMRAHFISQRAALASTFINSGIQVDRQWTLQQVLKLLPSEKDWSMSLASLMAQRVIDVFALDPLANCPGLDLASSTSPDTAPGIAMSSLEYTADLLADIHGLSQLISSNAVVGDEIHNAAGLTTDQDCHATFIELTSQLLACDSILQFPLSAHCSEPERVLMPNITNKISSVLTDVLLPSVVLLSHSGAYQLLSHVMASTRPTWIKASIISRLVSFISSTPSLTKPGQISLLSHLWTTVLSTSPQRLSILTGLVSSKWLSNLDTKLVIAKALSDLYQLKPSPSVTSIPTSDDVGYQLLVVSALVPHTVENTDSRKISEIFTFATKHAFSVASNTSKTLAEDRFLVGIAHFVSSIILATPAFSSRLTEANYAVLFDLTEKFITIGAPKTGKELDSLTYAAMVMLDSMSNHVFSLGTINTDAALFFQKALTPLCATWSSLEFTFDSWPASYLKRWASVMRFVQGSVVTRLEGESIGKLYRLVGVSTVLRVQCATFSMLMAVVKDHNAHTYTKSLSESTKLAAASSSASDDDSITEELLDSKVLPDQLQHLVLDVKLGYEDPLHPEDVLSDEDPIDRHVFDVSLSSCASTLLGWRLILEYLNSQDEKEKNDIVTWIRQSDLLQLLVPLLCHLVDLESPPKIEESTLERYLTNTAYTDVKTSLAGDVWQSYTVLRGIAFFVLRDAFEFIPALIRTWWQHSDSQLRSQLETFVGRMITPQLISKEVSRASGWKPASPLIDEFKIKASSIGEVVASYQKDEVELSITLKLSSAHPLKPVNVTMSHKAVSEALWRKWLLSMRSMLLTRDGSVLDAVLLWRDYLDRHFEGVECCPICYAIFHISNYTLPNLACKTCKNKFHKACLYKWFNTSHNNECPLCKTPFN